MSHQTLFHIPCYHEWSHDPDDTKTELLETKASFAQCTLTNFILKLANVGGCDAQTIRLELKALPFCGRQVLDKEHVAFGRRWLTYHATVSDAAVDAHDEDDDPFHASTHKHPVCRSVKLQAICANLVSK